MPLKVLWFMNLLWPFYVLVAFQCREHLKRQLFHKRVSMRLIDFSASVPFLRFIPCDKNKTNFLFHSRTHTI